MRWMASAVAASMTVVLVGAGVQPAVAEAPDSVVTGRIVDDLGRPVKGMEVRLDPDGSAPPIDLVTSATGEFRTTAATPGQYTLAAEEFFDDTFYWEPNPVKYTWVDARPVTVQEGTTSLGTFEVARGGTVRATVMTPTGHRLPRYLVEAKGAAGPVYGERYSFTDSRGILTLRGLPVGTWPLTGRMDYSDNIPKVTFPSVKISEPGQVVRGVKLVTKVHWSTFLRDRGYVKDGVPLAGPGEARFGVRIGNTYGKDAEFDLWRDKPLRLSLYRDGKRIKNLYVKVGKSKIYTLDKQPKGEHTYKWIWGGDADTFRIASKPLKITVR
ncbi:carboxypeptidase regulatory-like domain-containing protein [Aeromicrobium sp. Marseille-Q0843]|uniref:Carboxypeptidase regulatory-like domain-containing protein n=1 Tax=Aeromicrobium phoceense TaxID=2754045 RepID=A0A838XJX7_9ACTN|nr:carboxypeptidase-like regulatory domain-containing protein [Aeromicrobium phoceense]MBA4608926.1 carboxypeptidase regulatory-like domain-containing protein [Aeromicrobium phoceense]